MKLTDSLIERAERYLAGELSERTLRENDGAPLSDQQLAELIALVRSYQKGIRFHKRKESLGHIHKEVVASKRRRAVLYRTWLAAAAVVSLIFVFSVLFKRDKPAYDELFEPYPYLLNMRETRLPAMQEAIEAYASRDFYKANQLFSYLSTDSLDYDLFFYKAVNAMAIGDFTQAVADFERITVTPANPYYEQTRWYLGLAYWQSGDKKQALLMLDQIKPDQYAFKRARELEQYLDKSSRGAGD